MKKYTNEITEFVKRNILSIILVFLIATFITHIPLLVNILFTKLEYSPTLNFFGTTAIFVNFMETFPKDQLTLVYTFKIFEILMSAFVCSGFIYMLDSRKNSSNPVSNFFSFGIKKYFKVFGVIVFQLILGFLIAAIPLMLIPMFSTLSWVGAVVTLGSVFIFAFVKFMVYEAAITDTPVLQIMTKSIKKSIKVYSKLLLWMLFIPFMIILVSFPLAELPFILWLSSLTLIILYLEMTVFYPLFKHATDKLNGES
ncbi:MAG: hypothetical protein R2883_06655 [Caldisericia bacterium]